MDTIEYQDADAAWEAGNEWIKYSDKYEKLEFLKDSCTAEFLKEHLLNEIMKYIFEYQFNEIFDHLRRNWEIKTPQELEYAMHN